MQWWDFSTETDHFIFLIKKIYNKKTNKTKNHFKSFNAAKCNLLIEFGKGGISTLDKF